MSSLVLNPTNCVFVIYLLFLSFHISRNQDGIDVLTRQLTKSLRLLEFPPDGDIARVIDGYVGIADHIRTIVFSDTLLFIEESSGLQTGSQLRASYFLEIPSTECSHIVDICIGFDVVLNLEATPVTIGCFIFPFKTFDTHSLILFRASGLPLVMMALRNLCSTVLSICRA